MVEYRRALDSKTDEQLDFGELRPVSEGDDRSEEMEDDLYDDNDFEEEELQEELKRTALEFSNKLTELEMNNNQMMAQSPFIKEEDQV